MGRNDFVGEFGTDQSGQARQREVKTSLRNQPPDKNPTGVDKVSRNVRENQPAAYGEVKDRGPQPLPDLELL